MLNFIKIQNFSTLIQKTAKKRPIIKLENKKMNIRRGESYIGINNISNIASMKKYSPNFVTVETADGYEIGISTFDYRSSDKCLKIISKNCYNIIDESYIYNIIKNNIYIRDNIYKNYYRLINSHGDSMSGICIDRYKNNFIIICESPTFQRFVPVIRHALTKIVGKNTIFIRNDMIERGSSEMADTAAYQLGDEENPIIGVMEEGCKIYINLLSSPWPGWRYDLRNIRKDISKICENRSILDINSRDAAVSVICASKGAKSVTCVDPLSLCLQLGQKSVDEISKKVEFVHETALNFLIKEEKNEKKWDITVIQLDFPSGKPENMEEMLLELDKMAQLVARVTQDEIFFIINSSILTYSIVIDTLRAAIFKTNKIGKNIYSYIYIYILKYKKYILIYIYI
eukprot:GHVL01036090.1.p1 GENE.GHVL01036090.1~~GHVL01036090.1.p1  ORF type:complete len:400 (-),score=116.16 GHVL01036090.1:1147-2346(-)